MSLFEHYGRLAIQTVVASQREAQRAGSHQIDVEHLCLALLATPAPQMRELLALIGIEPSLAYQRIKSRLPRAEPTVGQLPLTEQTKHILALGRTEAEDVGASTVTPSHLLLASVRQRPDVLGIDDHTAYPLLRSHVEGSDGQDKPAVLAG